MASKAKSPRSPKASKSPKNKDNDELADLDSFVQEKTMSTGQAVFYFTIASVLSVLPAYLFCSVYDMPVSEYGLYYVVVTILSAVLLTLSYRNIAEYANAQLSNQRRGLNTSHKLHGYGTKEELEAVKVSATEREANAWSLFVNNSLFLAIFLFLAFYVLREIPFHYGYSLSVPSAAVLVWQFSSAFK